MAMSPVCRLCDAPLTRTFVDLGMSPLCESYVPAEMLDEAETFYPLNVRLCDACLLVQLPAYVPGEQIFSDYAYFSSYSDSWVAHAKKYAEAMVERLRLTSGSLVTEVASNDGYLLQHFAAAGVPVLGVEPAANVAEVARARGIPTEVQFLGADTGLEIAARHGRADLVAANNVFAHVPDIRGFAAGLRALVKDEGTVTLEFPHLMRLIDRRQYDTIYHEHFSYLSLLTSSRALAGPGCAWSTWTNSTRTAVRSAFTPARTRAPVNRPNGSRPCSPPRKRPDCTPSAGHEGFAPAVMKIKSDLLEFLLTAAREGKSVAGYGAPGKGNTLLNHCGIRSDLLSYTVDRSPFKQGKFLPGTHIPIYAPEYLAQTKPDYVLVLPWNLREEISRQLRYVGSWGGKLVFPIPELEVVTMGSES